MEKGDIGLEWVTGNGKDVDWGHKGGEGSKCWTRLERERERGEVQGLEMITDKERGRGYRGRWGIGTGAAVEVGHAELQEVTGTGMS